MGFFSWKKKRAYHKDKAKTVKFAKGEKMTDREKAIFSQGYMKGQHNAWDESNLKNNPALFENIKAERAIKREQYKADQQIKKARGY